MEIAFVYPMDIGYTTPSGTRTYVMGLISYLKKVGIPAALVGVSYKKAKPKLEKNVKFIPVVEGGKINSYSFFAHLFLNIFKLGFDKETIIHAQRPDYILPFVLFYKENPQVCTLHGIVERSIYLKKGRLVCAIYRLIERFTLRRVDRIIVLDAATRDFYLQKYPDIRNRFVVIPLGVDTAKFKPMDKKKMRKKYGFDPDDKIVLYIGRLERIKNLELLLKSYVEVEKSVDNTKLLIVGEGGEKGRLERLKSDLKLKDVMFMGALEHDIIPEIMNCADAFALCSLHESSPLVVVEALACGVPVVSVDVGRVRQFLQNPMAGRIVDYTEKDISSAVIYFLRNEGDAIRSACRESSLMFGFETTVKNTVKLYEQFKANL